VSLSTWETPWILVVWFLCETRWLLFLSNDMSGSILPVRLVRQPSPAWGASPSSTLSATASRGPSRSRSATARSSRCWTVPQQQLPHRRHLFIPHRYPQPAGARRLSQRPHEQAGPCRQLAVRHGPRFTGHLPQPVAPGSRRGRAVTRAPGSAERVGWERCREAAGNARDEIVRVFFVLTLATDAESLISTKTL
jgi:hypothetical protein